MQDLVGVFKETTNILTNLTLETIVKQYRPAAKKVVSECVLNDLTTPVLTEAVQFLNGITTEYSSANVIQAQRDFFGAHTYQKLNDASSKNYHTNWIE